MTKNCSKHNWHSTFSVSNPDDPNVMLSGIYCVKCLHTEVLEFHLTQSFVRQNLLKLGYTQIEISEILREHFQNTLSEFSQLLRPEHQQMARHIVSAKLL